MVNLCKMKLTILQQEILRLLFVKAGVYLNQRRISKILGVSQAAVKKALPGLGKDDLVKMDKDEESGRWSIGMKRGNPRVMELKRVDNLRRIYESGLAGFLETEFAGDTIILFGSYSRGEDTIDSDIDIAVVGSKEKIIDLAGFEEKLEREINISYFESFEKIHKNLKENLCNGIVLSGGFEL